MSWRALGLIAFCMATFLGALHAAEPEAPGTSAPVLASSTPSPSAASFQVTPSSGGRFQIAIYFVLLVALLGGGVLVMRNGLGFLQPKPKGPRMLEVSETRMLGNRQFLIVAEYEQRKMLIGVCPGRIEYLCTLSGAEPEFPRLPSEEEA